MKRYCFYLVLLLTVVALNGCIKDDNPYPVIRNTTWKMTYQNNWYRFSFSDSRVHGQMYERDLSGTDYTLTDFYADYVPKKEGGRGYYEWKNEDRNIKFWLYSMGPDNVVINLIFYGEGWSSGWSSEELFYRDEDPADGYNF